MFDVAELCGELFDVTPPTYALRGSSISIRWLCDQLSTPAPDANEVTLEQSARGFILALMGCKTLENSNFLKNDKIVISVKKSGIFIYIR